MEASRTQQQLSLAIEHHRAGRIAEAERLYRRVLAELPNHAVAVYRLGLLALQTGRNETAAELLGRSIVIDERNPSAQYNLGVSLQSLNRLDEAIAAYSRAVALQPRFPEALNNLGNAQRLKGELAPAIATLRQALAARPDYPDAWNNLGIALQQNGDLDEAFAAYRRALSLRPDLAAAHSNLGNALMERGDVDDAIAAFRRALAIDPRYDEAMNNLASALIRKNEFGEAIAACRQALAVRPGFAGAWNNLGSALRGRGDFDQAVSAYHRALELQGDYPEALNNLGNALTQKGDLPAAIDAYERAIERRGDYAEAHFGLALALLLKGDWDWGWREYEWRLRGPQRVAPDRQFTQPLWEGGDLAGRRILLHAEGGFGDAIHFVRYARGVAGRGSGQSPSSDVHVLLQCPPQLKRLFLGLPGVEQVFARGEPLPSFDLHCPLPTLPRVFGTTLQNLPADVPYLRADPALVEQWRERLGPGDSRLKVGLAWAGNPVHHNDVNRSMALRELLPVLSVPDVRFFSLQRQDAASELRHLLPELQVVDLDEDLSDFANTAAVLENLDLVISVDTAVAHLSGALARPTWLLLPFAPDFRWMLERDDSPWYPTMRLFRQTRPGDWAGVIERVSAELLQRTKSQAASQSADAAAEYARGTALHQEGAWEQAIERYRAAIAARPNFPEAWNHLGIALHQGGKIDEAIEVYQMAIGLDPDRPAPHGNLGKALREKGDLSGAVAAYRQALSRAPDDAPACRNLATALHDTGELPEAVALLKQSAALRPQDGEILKDLAAAEKNAGQWSGAIATYRRAIELAPDDPDAHFGLSWALLLGGDFVSGWREYEWRIRRPAWIARDGRPLGPPWDGSELAGRRILLHCEQGFGDTIQFVRYVPLVAGKGGRVILRCQPQLKRLLATLPGAEQVVGRDDAMPEFDLYCPLLSLPRAFGTTIDTIPAEVPYLHPDPAANDRWSARIAADCGRLKVGIVWAGSSAHTNDRRRSIQPAKLASLVKIPDIRFYSLQTGSAAEEIRAATDNLHLIDLGSELQDFVETAAVLASLDLLITVDTAAAHLAGAMGRPVWLMLPYSPDFRWMLDRADAPWYPTMRLFRQPRPGDWDSVLESVAQELQKPE